MSLFNIYILNFACETRTLQYLHDEGDAFRSTLGSIAAKFCLNVNALVILTNKYYLDISIIYFKYLLIE